MLSQFTHNQRLTPRQVLAVVHQIRVLRLKQELQRMEITSNNSWSVSLEGRLLKRIYQTCWTEAAGQLQLSKKFEIALIPYIILEAPRVQQLRQHLAVVPPVRPMTQAMVKVMKMKE